MASNTRIIDLGNGNVVPTGMAESRRYEIVAGALSTLIDHGRRIR